MEGEPPGGSPQASPASSTQSKRRRVSQERPEARDVVEPGVRQQHRARALAAAPDPTHLQLDGSDQGRPLSCPTRQVITDLMQQPWVPPYLHRICSEVLDEDRGRTTWIWCPDFLLEQYMDFIDGLRRLGVQLNGIDHARQMELMAELQAAGLAQRAMFRQLDNPQLNAIQLSFLQISEVNRSRHSYAALLRAHEDMLEYARLLPSQLMELGATAARAFSMMDAAGSQRMDTVRQLSLSLQADEPIMQRQSLGWVRSQRALARLASIQELENDAHFSIWRCVLGSEVLDTQRQALLQCCRVPNMLPDLVLLCRPLLHFTQPGRALRDAAQEEEEEPSVQQRTAQQNPGRRQHSTANMVPSAESRVSDPSNASNGHSLFPEPSSSLVMRSAPGRPASLLSSLPTQAASH